MSRTTLRAVVRTAAITLVATAALAGCGSDEDESEQEPQGVVTGVVLDGAGGAPVPGVEVELLVWPSPQAGATAPVGEAPELIRIDEQTTADDGTFDLEALAAELSPHASSDGQVGLEIRKVGAAGAGTRTSVRLSRGEGNGEFTVHTLEGLELTPAELGDR
ncbi:hypothetical protein [Nocardioides gilvus]|uniref:hypothetical protein n=1 Tax=Nocardioides gilvus TaxID=1735589 RepID=UPI000D744EA2|nr:hypothetical protein [Nocardioides gilvus]